MHPCMQLTQKIAMHEQRDMHQCAQQGAAWERLNKLFCEKFLMLCVDVFSAAAKSCTELYARGLEDNTHVTIDADGSGSNQPFTAYCQRNGTTAYTIIRTCLLLFLYLILIYYYDYFIIITSTIIILSAT